MTTREEVIEGLNKALQKLGHKIDDTQRVDGQVTVWIDRDRPRSGYEGKMRIKYGDYDIGVRAKQVPEGNGFDYDRIAAALSEFVVAHKAKLQTRRQRAREQSAVQVTADAINAEFPGMDVKGARVTSTYGGSLAVELKITCTPAQARALMVAASAVCAERDGAKG